MERNLTSDELDLLIDGLSDDISFLWVLIHLVIRTNPPPTSDWAPSEKDLHDVFDSLKRLTDLGLIRVGRIEYVDRGPPGRPAPVEHITEDLDVVRSRVELAVRTASVSDDWAYSCWIVNSEKGDMVAREALDREGQE